MNVHNGAFALINNKLYICHISTNSIIIVDMITNDTKSIPIPKGEWRTK